MILFLLFSRKALAGLELCRTGWSQTRRFTCLCFPRAGTKVIPHHCPAWISFLKTSTSFSSPNRLVWVVRDPRLSQTDNNIIRHYLSFSKRYLTFLKENAFRNLFILSLPWSMEIISFVNANFLLIGKHSILWPRSWQMTFVLDL